MVTRCCAERSQPASERVGGVAHDICDLYAEVKAMVDVTNPPTDLYSQADFKRRDVVLTFHDATYSWS